MHTALSLGSRHTLNTVNTRLVLQGTVNICSAYSEVDFLVSTYCTFRDRCHADGPSLRLTIFLIHREEVTGEEGSLVATGTATNLHLYILGILWVLRNQGDLDFFFELRLQRLVLVEFLARHLLHFRVAFVGEDILCFLDAVQTVDVSLACVHDVAKVFPLLGELHVAWLVGDDIRVGNEGAYFLVSAL